MTGVSDRWSGDGRCGFCLQTYVLQLEVYCAECDRPVCPLCAVHGPARTARLCPECTAGEGGEEG